MFAPVEGADVNGQPVVSLPANALVTHDGDAYTGQAVVSVAALDPSEDPTVMPGDFLSWDAESQTSAPIESYGAVNVALAADNGAPLQLDGVDLAQVSIPLAQRHPPGCPTDDPVVLLVQGTRLLDRGSFSGQLGLCRVGGAFFDLERRCFVRVRFDQRLRAER